MPFHQTTTAKKPLLLKLFSLLFLGCVFCSTYAAEKSIEKIRLIWHEDPAHHAVLAWCGDQGTVTYGVKGSDETNSAMITRSTNAIGLRNNFVHLKDLKADTDYSVQIVTRAEKSKQLWFKTAPDIPKNITFIAGGDSRNHRDARIRANRMVAKLRPLFVAFGGDMTNRDTHEEWLRWLDDWELTTGADGKLTPIVATRGNHERKNESVSNLFNSPHPSIYYATSIGGPNFIRLYTLNTEIEVGGDQKAWLAKDLKANPNVLWKMAQYHKPMRAHVASKREGIPQYRAWVGLFYQYGFNLVFESDSHTVKRTWPIRPSLSEGSFEGFIRDDKNGIVFVGEGCWGAPLRPANDNKPWTKASSSFNQFKWVHLFKDKIEVRSVAVDNVDEVEQITDDDLFKAPKGLKLWTPDSGAVETIPARPNFKPNTDDLSSLQILDTTVSIQTDAPLFDEKSIVAIQLETTLPGKLHYTLDGSTPNSSSPVYEKPFTFTESTMIRAVFIADNGDQSFISTGTVKKIPDAIGTAGPKPDVLIATLDWTEQKAGWGETKKNLNIGKRPLRMRGIIYDNGLGMHAQGHVTYTCDPSWKRFVASVGHDDQIRGERLGEFVVEADGVAIYRSPKPFTKYDLHHINVEIPAGTKVIKLIADASEDGPGYDNINMVNAGFCLK